MAWTDTTTALSGIGALLVATITLIWNVRESRRTSAAIEKTADAAAASARAAEVSTSHFSRMADALEASMADDEARDIAIARALPIPTAAWKVTRLRGSTFELTNAGNGSAYEVQVSAVNAVRFRGPEPTPEWKPGESRELQAIGSWQTGLPELTVTWRKTPVATDEVRWTRALPQS